jgi:hypothetical protein
MTAEAGEAHRPAAGSHCHHRPCCAIAEHHAGEVTMRKKNELFGNVTEQTIEGLIRRGQYISILRSGFYHRVGPCIDNILKICKRARLPKQIRIILPSVTNQDVRTRATALGVPLEDMIDQLREWQRAITEAGKNLDPRHSLQLRTTVRPHRYHAFLSEKEAIVGFAWHQRAALSTTSFHFHSRHPDVAWALTNFEPDFNWMWNDSQHYIAGEHVNLKPQPGNGDGMVRDILLRIGRGLDKSMTALRFTAHFPDADGNGATCAQLEQQYGGNDGDWNKKFIQLEDIGLVRMVRNANGTQNYGRVLTFLGTVTLVKCAHLAKPMQALQATGV